MATAGIVDGGLRGIVAGGLMAMVQTLAQTTGMRRRGRERLCQRNYASE
jgi:hypothetical protein